GGPPLGHGCGLHQLHELVFGELLQVSLDGAVVACVSGIAEETSEERALLLCGLPRPPVVDVRPVLGATLDSGVGREDRSSVPDGVVYRFVRKLLRLQAKELRYLRPGRRLGAVQEPRDQPLVLLAREAPFAPFASHAYVRHDLADAQLLEL